MTFYPRIFLACHTRHVTDSATGRVLSQKLMSILDHLDPSEPTGLLGLARHMGVTAATMCVQVDKLVRGGYVGRERDASDARRVKLRLTPAGVAIKAKNSVLDAARVRSMLKRLNSREQREAIRGLALLARAAGEEMAAHGVARHRARQLGRPAQSEV